MIFRIREYMQFGSQTADENSQTFHSIHSARTLLRLVHLLESYNSYSYDLFNRPSPTGLPKHDLTKKHLIICNIRLHKIE